MARRFLEPQLLRRDGTSQKGRELAALDPDYVRVDERTDADLLAFARALSTELRYYDESNQIAGTWNRFLDAAEEGLVELDEVVAFMDAPERFGGAKGQWYGRPHVALFLTFLKLLGHARDHLNSLTRRHLEHYYEAVLRMTKKAAVPDRVAVLFRLAAGVESAYLPSGTALTAGKDSTGRARVYRTERDLVVNRARVERAHTVFADSRVTTLRDARERHEGTAHDAFMAMLSLALGTPLPGDTLPSYTGTAVDFDFVVQRGELLRFSRSGLFLELHELRSLMQLKRRRDGADNEWAAINDLLELAGRTRDRRFRLRPDDPRDFETNLAAAVGGPPNFDGLPQVETMTDVYEHRVRADVRAFIRDQLFFRSFEDFVRMMQMVVRIDGEWREVNRLLERGGRRKRNDAFYTLDVRVLADFGANFEAALGPVQWPRGFVGIDAYEAEVRQLERYFHMSAEDLLYLAHVAGMAEPGPSANAWSEVYALLAAAHREKVFTGRRDALAQERGDRNNVEGFDDLVRAALGQDGVGISDPGELLAALRAVVSRPSDLSRLTELRVALAGGAQLAPDEWDEVYHLLEVAQRKQLGLPEPQAQKVEWRNLYAYENATAVAGRGASEAAGTPSWRTFGQAEAPNAESAPAELVGWAVTSPLLAVSEGRRTLILTLGFSGDAFDADAVLAALTAGAFRASISTEKAWLELGVSELAVVSGSGGTTYQSLTNRPLEGAPSPLDKPLPAFQLTFALGADADPITPPPEGSPIISPWPVLRLLLRQVWDSDADQFVTLYTPFRHLTLAATHLQVEVDGLTSLRLQNDQSTLDPKKPIELFGARPSVGSRFYVTHPELLTKRLDSLQFELEWMGVPSDLTTHYANYGINNGAGPAATDFKARISLVDRRLPLSLKPAQPLFELASNQETAPPQTVTITDVPGALAAASASHHYRRILDVPVTKDVQAWPRYVAWELTPLDFQHRAYPAVASQQALELAAAIAKDPNSVTASDFQVNPPYTPVLKSLSASYVATVEVLAQGGAGEEAVPTADRLFHLHPFGYHPVGSASASGATTFLPQYDHEGELYLALSGVEPRQNVTLLFQMAEGSADPDLEPTAVEWSVLSGDRWLSLHDGNVLSDTTRGLINSGILELTLDPVAPSTRVDGELYWLRAAIPHRSDSVCDTVAVRTQAVSATFVDQGNAPDHYAQPLPEETIARLAKPRREIAAVEQPYTSYGGKLEEQPGSFYTRVAERLRHKQRALTAWDYERLVLERFPQIYKAKCLPANAAEALGEVVVIVIPDVRNQLPFAPFEPKAAADLLADIQAHLSALAPAFAEVSVRNAHYIPVRVRFGVRFKAGWDEGYCKKRLVEELNRFLSPWAYEEGADIAIGERIYANSIVNFVDRREYVDYVASIRLFKSEDGRTFQPAPAAGPQGYYVASDRPDGVLVAAQEHQIDIISEVGFEEQLFTGINYMKIELDFIVGSDG